MVNAYVFQGDCREVLKGLPENYVDTVITDPPYHLVQASRKGSPQPGDLNTPYGRSGPSRARAGFMGKTWDGGGVAFEPETWKAVLRVTKPGGFLMAFGGTRTWHRLACAIEDAGWEIRDSMLMLWAYGSGFPKSHNISKSIDKAARGVPHGGSDPTSPAHGKYKSGCSDDNPEGRGFGAGPGQFMKEPRGVGDRKIVHATGAGLKNRCRACGKPFFSANPCRCPKPAPETPEAKSWQGWGTALKPAWEPIIVAMKPCDGTFAENALKYGTAGLNIDGGRIGSPAPVVTGRGWKGATGYGHDWSREGEGSAEKQYAGSGGTDFAMKPGPRGGSLRGRWPANLVLSHTEDCVLVGYADDKGYVINRFTDGAKPFGNGAGHEYETEEIVGGKREVWACPPGCPVRMLDDQTGVLKSGKAPETGFVRNTDKTRNTYQRGWKGTKQEPSVLRGDQGGASRFFYCSKVSKRERNNGLPEGVTCSHPTMKPIALMRYLCRLTKTPTQGIVLDPFCGSGSTGVACIQEGRDFVGIELEEESHKIAQLRIKHALETPEEAPKPKKKKKAKKRKARAKKRKKKR